MARVAPCVARATPALGFGRSTGVPAAGVLDGRQCSTFSPVGRRSPVVATDQLGDLCDAASQKSGAMVVVGDSSC